MNTTYIRSLLVAGILAVSFCTASTAAAIPGASLTIPSTLPGSNAVATVTLTDFADIESFTLTLDFAPIAAGTVLTLPASGWFGRGAFFPVSPFGTATTVELNNAAESTARTRIFIDGFKPTGAVGAVGTVTFLVDSTVATGAVQQVSLSGQYLSKTSGTVSSFAPFSTIFSVNSDVTKLLTVSLAGSGDGAVNSNPTGIACTGGSCAAAFPSGSTVSLMASPDSISTFGGWSGDCINSSGNCSITMDTVKNATATFTEAPLLKLLGTLPVYYSLLQSAYTASATGATIQGRSVTLTENLLFDRPVSIKLKGGYDSGFTSSTGMSTVKGKVVIRQGTVRVERLIVK